MPSHSKIPAWYTLSVAERTLVAPEYGNFAKPLKIGPIMTFRRPRVATADRAGWNQSCKGLRAPGGPAEVPLNSALDSTLPSPTKHGLKRAGSSVTLPLREGHRSHWPLRLQRCHIGGDRHHVVAGQFLDHALHQGGRRAAAVAGLEVVDLARDIAGRTARDIRHVAQSLQPDAMADRARQRLAAAARGHQRLAFGETAD